MSVAKRGARSGVAALALGLSLAGPHTVGTAAAEPAENGSPSVASPQPGPARDTPARVRPSRPAPKGDSDAGIVHRGRGTAEPAATTGSAEPTTAPSADPRPVRRAAGHRTWQDQPGDSGAGTQPKTALPASPSANPVQSNSSTTSPLGSAVPAFGLSASPAPAAAVAVATATPRPAASVPSIFTTPPPAVVKPIASIGVAVTSFFDSAANFLSGLPDGPITDFFEGALLLVRRTLFNAFPALNAGQTTGTETVNPAYFTKDELQAYLLDLAKQQYGDLFGQTVPVYGNAPWPEYYKTDATTGVVSDTNTQVSGVDEADFVENDGQYMYVAHNGRLSIVRTDLSVASESTLSGNVVGEYLSGDRLTVITQSGSGWYGPYVKMAYGYWGPWKPQTTVTVYDVTDRTAPTVVKETVFDGGYQSSRAIDGVVYVVLQRSVNLPAPNYTDTPVVYVDGGVTPDDTVDLTADPVVAKPIRFDPTAPTAYRTYETWDEYLARVGPSIADLSLPHAYTVDSDGNLVDLGLVAGAEDIVRPHSADQQSLLTVVSLNSAGPAAGPAFADSVAAMVSSTGGTVYMTQGALYVATPEYHYTGTSASTDTRIDRFVVTGSDLSWQAGGLVSGTLINQFAMDEQNGYLRVATHTASSHWSDGTTATRDDNGIYILDTAGTTLDEVGQLTGLAPGEQLYAVRYVGGTAYLVTFVRTDPLFAVDLSDPAAPALQGELVVPGFSNYLQSVGDGLLLGIGQEREPGTWNSYVHATLFNVSDGTNLSQIDREFLDPGSQWSWSEAQFDHHALLYTAEDGLLVVPVSGSGYDAQTGYHSDQFLKVLRVGPNGIEVVGEIHTDEPVLRTVRIGDVLYAVGDTSVTAYRLSDLSEIGSSAPAPSVV